MISDTMAWQLHDQLTRGQPLSLAEQSLLANWYRLQDQGEYNLLKLNQEDTHLRSLTGQVAESLTQLEAVTRQIQAVTAENDQLRRENLELRRHLVQTSRLSLAV